MCANKVYCMELQIRRKKTLFPNSEDMWNRENMKASRIKSARRASHITPDTIQDMWIFGQKVCRSMSSL